ncbi:MAG: hypothetical protein EOP45_22675, partial [Sphingobacteriaceae bacterium]
MISLFRCRRWKTCAQWRSAIGAVPGSIEATLRTRYLLCYYLGRAFHQLFFPMRIQSVIRWLPTFLLLPACCLARAGGGGGHGGGGSHSYGGHSYGA